VLSFTEAPEDAPRSASELTTAYGHLEEMQKCVDKSLQDLPEAIKSSDDAPESDTIKKELAMKEYLEARHMMDMSVKSILVHASLLKGLGNSDYYDATKMAKVADYASLARMLRATNRAITDTEALDDVYDDLRDVMIKLTGEDVMTGQKLEKREAQNSEYDGEGMKVGSLWAIVLNQKCYSEV
jgi:hypothetical protein